MVTVIVPYGEKVETTAGEFYYGKNGLRLLENYGISGRALSGVSIKCLPGRGREVEVHFLPSHDGYNGPVALLLIRNIRGKG